MPKVIYEPRGRAKEYSPLAVNLYRGCPHGCRYCYAPAAQFTTHASWKNDVRPREGILEALRKDAAALAGDPRTVMLCFLCDPYQPVDDEFKITRQALQILAAKRMRAQVLTKDGPRAERDFDILAANNFFFGTSLVWHTDKTRQHWEPAAASVKDRIGSIRKAKKKGIFTWVSLEPVVDPDEALAVIRDLHADVDFWKIGKLNHMTPPRPVDWAEFYNDVTTLLQGYNADYYVKNDLWRHAQTSSPARVQSMRVDLRSICPAACQ